MTQTGNATAVTVAQEATQTSVPHARRAVIVRRLDQLGRIVLPIEMRRSLGIGEGAAVTIEEAPDGRGFVLRPWEAACALCGQAPEEGVFEVRNGSYLCRECARAAATLHDTLEGGR